MCEFSHFNHILLSSSNILSAFCNTPDGYYYIQHKSWIFSWKSNII